MKKIRITLKNNSIELIVDNVVEFSFGRKFFYYIILEAVNNKNFFKCGFVECKYINSIQIYSDINKSFRDIKIPKRGVSNEIHDN